MSIGEGDNIPLRRTITSNVDGICRLNILNLPLEEAKRILHLQKMLVTRIAFPLTRDGDLGEERRAGESGSLSV